MANLPNDVEPIKISYTYPDGRVFYVEGEELKKLRNNMRRAAGTVAIRRSSFHGFDQIDWTVNYPAHGSRP